MERAQELIAGVVDRRAADLADEDWRPLGELASSRYDAVATEVVSCAGPAWRLACEPDPI